MISVCGDERVGVRAPSAVRHFGRGVGETEHMHRVSDRAERRARAQGEWAP
jgi:hypothetical protein